MVLEMAMFVEPSVGPPLLSRVKYNVSATTGRIAMTFSEDIHPPENEY